MNSRLVYFRSLAEESLTPERLRHTLGVEALAAELAPKYGIDPDDARLAALVHDLAKGYSQEEQIRRAQEWKLIQYPEDLENPQVIHGRIAAYELQHVYGLDNRDILNAVANHTLGRPDMSPLEMLIYSADLTETGRDFPGVDKLRQKLYHDLREGTTACVEHTLAYLRKNNKQIHPLTALTYASLTSEGESKGGLNLEISPVQLEKVIDYIEDKKGHNITVLDLKGISVIADYFMIATGNSTTQTKAITEYLVDKLPEMGIKALRTEGLPEAQWVLIDCGDLVIHIMTPDTREFYSLERLWGDAREVTFQ